MRNTEDVMSELTEAPDAPPDLLDELFWSAMARGLASGTAGWGRLFADIIVWSKTGGDNAKLDETRITDAEAAELIRGVLGNAS